MNTEHKELLELAAKACGYTLAWGESYRVGDDLVDCTDMAYIKSESPDETDVYWSPHLDDGDGARMEAERAISPYFHGDAVTSITSGQVAFEDCINITELLADHNGNRQAARRMASLRVAAEVGRRMK